MKRGHLLVLLLFLALSCTRKEYSISIDGISDYTLSESSVNLRIKVLSDAPSWDYDLGGASWITQQSKSDNLLELSVAANGSPSPRSTTILFTVPTGASASVRVNQQGKPMEPELSVPAEVSIPSGGSSIGISVSTNQESWEAVLLDWPLWLSLDKSGNDLIVSAPANPTEEVRTARIRVYAPSADNMKVYSDVVVRQEASVIEYEPENLSEGGTSNCYIICHRGVYSFDGTIRGNGKTVSGLKAPAAIEPAGVCLVWQTVKGMISDLSLSDGTVSFEASKAEGSAVIAVTDASGDILWSWHIWHPSVDVLPVRSTTGDELMNINLGALDGTPEDISSFGMLYQWGRKDPFPYSPVASGGSVYTVNIPVYDINGNKLDIGHTDMYSSKDNTLAYSISHPQVCISNNNQFASTRDWLIPSESNAALWGNPDGSERRNGVYQNLGSKTYYDPCPPGWRVPPVRTYVPFTESGGYTWATGDTQNGLFFADLGGDAEVAVADIDEDGKYTLSDWQCGWWFWLDKSAQAMSYFPAAARYDGQYAMLMGSMAGLWGNYWSNAPTDMGLAYAMSFSLMNYSHQYEITVSPTSNGSRADAYSVRCIKEL